MTPALPPCEDLRQEEEGSVTDTPKGDAAEVARLAEIEKARVAFEKARVAEILEPLRVLAEAEAAARTALHAAIASLLALPPKDRGVEGEQIAEAIGLSRQQLYQISRNVSGSLRERRAASRGGRNEGKAQAFT